MIGLGDVGKTREHRMGAYRVTPGIEGREGLPQEKTRVLERTLRSADPQSFHRVKARKYHFTTQITKHARKQITIKEIRQKNKGQFRLQKLVLSALYEMTEGNKSWNDRTGDTRLPQRIR